MKSGKKILSLALALIMVFSMLPGSLFASAATGGAIYAGTKVTSPGREVKFRIMLSSLPAGGIDAASFDVNYDPSVFSYNSVSGTSRFKGTCTPSNDAANGVLTLSWTGDGKTGCTSVGGADIATI